MFIARATLRKSRLTLAAKSKSRTFRQQVNIPAVGTDNFDFMMAGIPNLVAMQEDANYTSNYHAAPDTFNKIDQQQLKLNSAIAAAMVWGGFANADDRLPRHTHGFRGRQN